MDLTTFTHFLGWVTLVNIGIFALAAIMVSANQDGIIKIHKKMFGLKKEDLQKAYFDYLGRYKLLIIVFNLVPYLVLRLVDL